MSAAPAMAPAPAVALPGASRDAELACERELIHLPGAIQPHGALLAFDALGVVLQVSANLGRWLPAGDAAQGLHLADLIGDAGRQRVEQALAGLGDDAQHALIELPARPAHGQPQTLEVLLHRHAGVCIAEVEPGLDSAQPRLAMPGVYGTLEALGSAASLSELLDRSAPRIRQLLACDRVMIYRFHPDWHGEVVADARESGLESLLGLHYPAGDIPKQARALYLHNPVRYLADVDAPTVALRPCIDDARLQPLDMSHTLLRSVSPVHLQYLRNMGVRATLTLSIVVEGRLWGLVACHHHTPLALPLRLRLACRELSQQLGLMIGWGLLHQQATDQSVALQGRSRIVDAFNRTHLAIGDVIERCHTDLLALLGASGGAFWQDGRVWPVGHWPGGPLGDALLRRMRADFEVSRDELLASDALDLEDGFSAIERRQTCGMLALRLDPYARAGLVWLRPEQRREVVWGGDPDHATQLSLDAKGQAQLSPRSSFARWEQHVEGRSRAWTPADLAAARGLMVLQPVLALRDALAETRRSDSQFRSLVAVQADAYWQIDAGGTLVALSKPLRMLTGALLGRRLVDLLGPHLTPASFEMLNRALSRGEPFRDLHLSGSEPRDALPFELRVHGTPLRDAGECDAGWHGTLTDLSREMAQQRELAQRDAQQQAMLDNDLIAIIKVRDGRISWKNRAMDRLFGYRGDELIGQAQINLCADAAGVDLLGQLSHTELDQGRSCRVQLAMRRQDGKCLWIDLSGMLLSPATQESMWLMNDISAMRALQEQAEHQARHDSLTRLPNRTLLLERLEQALASSARHGVSLALCFLDLDGFKPINDQHGHAAGDEVLRTLAQRLTVMVRLEDTVSRMGGDEFVLLLPHAGSRSELGALLQRLLAALALPVRLDTGILVRVTASAGVALSPADGIDAAALMLNADAALYAGKAQGGNTVCFAADLGQRSE